jgi:hypothetical protein
MASSGEDTASHYVTTIIFLMTFYARENMVGPSVYTEYVEETLAPIVRTGALPKNDLDMLSNKNEKLQDFFLKHFERDGEEIYHKSQFLILLYAAEFLFSQRPTLVQDASSYLVDFSMLWKARLSFWITLHLSSSVTQLMDESLAMYADYVDKVR